MYILRCSICDTYGKATKMYADEDYYYCARCKRGDCEAIIGILEVENLLSVHTEEEE